MTTISSKGIYALAAMYTLSHSIKNKPMQIKEISAMTSISHGYLEQILSILRKAGLVNSIRGAGGGYTLGRSASEIAVLEIIEAVEGPLFKIEGNVGSSIVLETFWQHMQEQVKQLFALKLNEVDQFFQPYYYEI